jgi:hypothetical protein
MIRSRSSSCVRIGGGIERNLFIASTKNFLVG